MARLLTIAAVAGSCAPVSAGPELPRPALPATISTTAPATTTTLDPVTALTTQCPTSFCLVYHIDPEAEWSDGTPVTAADLARTVDEMTDPVRGAPNPGYELVTSVDVVDPKTARVVFSEPFGGWEDLFDRIVPAGPDLADPAALLTTGAFRFVEWVPGDRIVLQRAPGWWSQVDPISGAPLGDVNSVTFVFMPDVEEMVGALSEGEVDMISVRPDLELAQLLAGTEGVVTALAPGPFWEHIAFHHQDELLGEDWAREAISLAIDREGILDRTIRLLAPEAAALDNTIWMSNTYAYEAHYAVGHDPARAEEILDANACPRGGDGVRVCGDRRMSFTWTTTSDDPFRREAFLAAAEDLAAVGIEIVSDFRTPSAFVTREHLFGGPDVWQLIEFSWRARSDPRPSNQTYFCDDSDLNVNRYCSADVEDLVRSTDTIVDPVDRVAAYNEADRLYLEDFAVIPLYQKASLMAFSAGITGPAPNYTSSTDTWNLAAWSGKESIVIALPNEPVSLDPRSYGDEAANQVISALLYGAFGMDPAHQHVPALVDSVDVIEG